MAATLEDVARVAGVSTATVSRVLNDPDKVAQTTRARVSEAVEALGYTPNFGARMLASNRTNTVGAIIPSLSNAMFASGIQAFQEVLSEAGVNMLLGSTGYSDAEELRQIKTLLEHGAGGLLLIGTERPAETYAYMARRNVPFVVSWATSELHLSVGFDNTRAAFEMTQAVLARGHRDIAMIAGPMLGNDRATDRVAGVRAAIAQVPDARLVHLVEQPYRLEHGADGFSLVMQHETPPSAIICGNDVLAAGALIQARRDGVSVPDQVSIVGFDDIGLASVSAPAITTVRVPQIEMGRQAASVLLGAIAGRDGVVSETLDTEVILRASLGDVPRK